MIKQYYWKTEEGSLQNTGCGSLKMQVAIEKRLKAVTIKMENKTSILSDTLFKKEEDIDVNPE